MNYDDLSLDKDYIRIEEELMKLGVIENPQYLNDATTRFKVFSLFNRRFVDTNDESERRKQYAIARSDINRLMKIISFFKDELYIKKNLINEENRITEVHTINETFAELFLSGLKIGKILEIYKKEISELYQENQEIWKEDIENGHNGLWLFNSTKDNIYLLIKTLLEKKVLKIEENYLVINRIP